MPSTSHLDHLISLIHVSSHPHSPPSPYTRYPMSPIEARNSNVRPTVRSTLYFTPKPLRSSPHPDRPFRLQALTQPAYTPDTHDIPLVTVFPTRCHPTARYTLVNHRSTYPRRLSPASSTRVTCMPNTVSRRPINYPTHHASIDPSTLPVT